MCLSAVLTTCGINPAFDDTLAATSTSTTPTTSGPAPTTSPLDPTTTTSTETGGSATEALTSRSTATSDVTTTSDDTTGEPPPPPPEPEHLQHYDPANCLEPLWCHAQDGGVFVGRPARVHSQACFNPAAQPFRLVHLDYVIAAVLGDNMGDAFLEIRSYDPMAPGPPLVPAIPLVNADILVGTREYTFDPPIELDVDAFCVGFTAGHIQPAEASLGVAIDPVNLPEDQSYVRSEGPMGCNTLIWLDIHDIDPTPRGGWCIAADVESVP